MNNKKHLKSCAGIILIMIIAVTILSCDRSGEIPVKTWKTTGVHRIEVVFGDTTNWVGQCVFTSGYDYNTGQPLYENGVRLNVSTGMYIEKQLRSYNIYSGEKCNFMVVGISAYPRSPNADTLVIRLRGYVNDRLMNTMTYEFAPEMGVKAIDFRSEEKYEDG